MRDPPTPLCCSDLISADGEVIAGNLNFCGTAGEEPFRLGKGDPDKSGVEGAVPAFRLGYFSAEVESASEGENEETRGEGCVVDR